MNISESSIRKPITTVMIALSVIVLGAISLGRLPLEYMPDLTFPAIYIEVSYPSSSPEEIERAIQNGQDIADCQILRLSNKLVPPSGSSNTPNNTGLPELVQ